jgi:hypothetical protein
MLPSAPEQALLKRTSAAAVKILSRGGLEGEPFDRSNKIWATNSIRPPKLPSKWARG